jgi:uncharacterized protein (TIRG00374 family)
VRRSTILRAVIGAAISIVALWLVLRSVDIEQTAAALGRANGAWIVVSATFLSTDLAIRSFRWTLLLAPIASVPYRRMVGYLLIGYVANNVLPARLGELVRSHYLGDREGISRAAALGTVVVERVVDLAIVVAIASLALLVLSVRGIVAGAVLVGAGVAGLLLVAVALGIVAHRLPGADRARRLLESWPRIRGLASSLQGGLAVAGRPRTLVAALATSAVAWSMTTLAFAAAGQSIGLQLTIGQAALLSSGVALASAVPAGPSNLGTFELAAVEIGKAIGIEREPAFALALLVHATILAVTFIGGAVAFARLGWRRPTESQTAAEG